MAGLTEHGEKSGFEGVNPVRNGADRIGFVEGGGSSPSDGGAEKKSEGEEEEEASHGPELSELAMEWSEQLCYFYCCVWIGWGFY